MHLQCLILDLDNTLIDTSSIAKYRDNGQWKEAYDGIAACPIFPDTKKIIDVARKAGLKVALATNSPTTYANKILRYFDINIDYVVAFHDVKNHKPSPDCINKILKHFSLSPAEAIYLGDSIDDKLCAGNANVEFFAVDWASFADLNESRVGVENLFKFISESVSQQKFHQNGKLIQLGNKYFLGYYLDPVKKEIWSFKDGKKESVNRWVNYAYLLAQELPVVDFVVRAFGHAETNPENQKKPLDILGEAMSRALGAKYLPNILRKNRILEKSTGLGAIEREEQIDGAYEIDFSLVKNLNLSGASFLIIDDVLTTGATTNEISKTISRSFKNATINIFTLVKTIYREDSELLAQHSSELFYALYNIKCITLLADNTNSGSEKVKLPIRPRKLKNKLFTANYSNTNHNFIIQNLNTYSIAAEPQSKALFSALQIIKNILQRGTPTIPSRLLRKRFAVGYDSKLDEGKGIKQALISQQPIKWIRQIRGDDSRELYPARHFFDVLLPKYLNKLIFIRQLIVPEIKISEITQKYVAGLFNRQVDFYIPQIGLIIEIDGSQHERTKELDNRRDEFTRSNGLNTIRISSREIYSECDVFHNKIESLIGHINQQIKLENDAAICIPNGITLTDYQNAYQQGVDVSKNNVILTAVMRFQLLILELIECGRIKLGHLTTINLINRDGIEDFFSYALEDLNEMLGHQLTLLGKEYAPLLIDIIQSQESLPNKLSEDIIIDFSILQRFSDEFQDNLHIIYVRTDYQDFYRENEIGSSHSMRAQALCPIDYFQVSCDDPIEYNLDLSPGSSQRNSILYFLSNIFLPYEEEVDFREGQIGIIGSALSRKSTIGLLPTGSGKSICYQLAALLQPAISFVVCPIKSLMYDQKADLDTIGITRTGYITSDQSATEKTKTQKKFGSAKYFFVFISPERFQTKAFRKEMRAIGLDHSFAFAVIDEVHCLSEWGHDFRTSYLNLSNAITRFAPKASYIGLTATASVNVLKDIQSEFSIPNENVRTPLEFTRPELQFDVIDDLGSKTDLLVRKVEELDKKWNGVELDEQRRAGIVFTSTVNGKHGCYELASILANALEKDVRYYSGSAPTSGKFQNEAFDHFKREVQNDFKSNKYDLLTATKAFGMGVNKGNIAFTIHYGIPGSMEALYQEAGRAGRNKKLFSKTPADCLVLMTREGNEVALNKVWDPTITVDELKSVNTELTKGSDVSMNLWLMTHSLDSINDEFKLMYSVYTYLINNPGVSVKQIQAKEFGTEKSKLEKVVYRLCQLGIVKDWTIEDFYRGKLEVEISYLSEAEIGFNLEKTIRKYELDFELDKVSGKRSKFYNVLCARQQSGAINQVQFIFLILLIWSYDHFVYNRRQSLKTVYEQCGELASNLISKKDFKERLESYFKFNESSQSFLYLAENTTSPETWLNVFYEDDPHTTTSKLIGMQKALELKTQLARFLESYKDNIALNYISGILRLITEQFDDSDGEQRMAASLSRISNFSANEIEAIITKTASLAPLLSDDAKSKLTEILYKHIPDDALLEKLNESFQDEYSYKTLLGKIEKKLSKIVTKLKEVDWWLESKN